MHEVLVYNDMFKLFIRILSYWNQTFLLAFAVTPTENSEFWNKVLEKLNISLDLMHTKSLVILRDREKGIANAISTIIPMAFHS